MSDTTTITPDAAKAALEAEMKERADQCAKEFEKLLAKYGCDISVAMLVTPQGNAPQLRFVPRPR